MSGGGVVLRLAGLDEDTLSARLEALRLGGCAWPGTKPGRHDHDECVEVSLEDVRASHLALRVARERAARAVANALGAGASQQQVDAVRGRS